MNREAEAGDLSHFTDTGLVRDGLQVFSGGPRSRFLEWGLVTSKR